VLTDAPGGQAAISITPPVHRLSLLCRIARADFARALIAAADAPAVSGCMFDVSNAPGPSPSDTALAAQFDRIRQGAVRTYARRPAWTTKVILTI